jgi:PAS domain-containing protein
VNGQGIDVNVGSVIAFRDREWEPPGLAVRVNFGIFAGREATPAEIDDLAAQLLPVLHDVSIVAEQRHEIGEDAEASLHQVRIEVDDENLPEDELDRDVLADRIVETAERWAEACIAERHAEVTEL